ncbi:hypothetical protein GCM10028778_11600 [Barrientosiimonas marina]|uniref:Phage holin n=1 Tax=Lentibacillus kimchii TaxID=1542911 RepID=A0ABW2V0F5_9BACI
MKKAIIRLVVLAILLINQILTTIGFDSLPFSQDQIYEGVSSVATVIGTIWTWWKNNNMTPEAQHADNWMKAQKRKHKQQQNNMKGNV